MIDLSYHVCWFGLCFLDPVSMLIQQGTDPVTTTRASSSSTSSVETLAMAAQWIDNCVKHHSKCRQNAESKELPPRVLDLGVAGDSSSVCLHITTEHSPKSPYATLSHCWGKTPIFKLQKSNLEKMQASIDCKELPRTFQDAIGVARRLGLRFLWIDSLCIIQDSIEDWTMQSAVMGDIYQNSFITIAAIAAKDGRFGCFSTRDPRLVEPCKAVITKRKGGTLSYTILTGLHVIVPFLIWSDGVGNAPLNKRGCVLQERILSPRTIHFGEDQLFWECRELVSIALNYTFLLIHVQNLPLKLFNF